MRMRAGAGRGCTRSDNNNTSAVYPVYYKYRLCMYDIHIYICMYNMSELMYSSIINEVLLKYHLYNIIYSIEGSHVYDMARSIFVSYHIICCIIYVVDIYSSIFC